MASPGHHNTSRTAYLKTQKIILNRLPDVAQYVYKDKRQTQEVQGNQNRLLHQSIMDSWSDSSETSNMGASSVPSLATLNTSVFSAMSQASQVIATCGFKYSLNLNMYIAKEHWASKAKTNAAHILNS
jgi:hypothetical protein